MFQSTASRIEDPAETLASLAPAVVGVCAGLDPESVPLAEAVGVFECLARLERAIAGAKVRMLRRVEASTPAAASGARDTAEFLAQREGVSIARAREALATSKRLLDQPQLDEAVAQGRLSGAQAEAIADVAAANPGAAAGLVERAQDTSFGELRRACAEAKAAADPDPEATHRRIHAGRHVRRGVDLGGAWTIRGQGTVDAGAEVDAALEPIIDELLAAARQEGRRESREAYAFDALVELARRSVSGAVGPKKQAERHLALIRIDLEALVRGAIEGGERCELTGLGPIPVSTARELLGDSILKLVITRGVDVANVTHLGRGPTAAQRIALLWSQPVCSVLGPTGTTPRARPPHRLGRLPRNEARQPRPPVRSPSPPQDPTPMGARTRNRGATHGRTRRSETSGQRPTMTRQLDGLERAISTSSPAPANPDGELALDQVVAVTRSLMTREEPPGAIVTP